MTPIEEPLKQVFEFESSYCLCVMGIPNRPDGTVIPGLGKIPSMTIPSNDFYASLDTHQITPISEPSFGVISACFLSIAMSLINRAS